MKHRLLTSVVAVVLALFMGASAAAQSGNNSRYYQFADTAAASVSSPASGRVRLFFDSTGFYWKNSAGVVTAVGGGGFTLTQYNIPMAATTTTLGDSKMNASGTNRGTWTLYDSTAVTGASIFDIRAGAGQSTTALQNWRNNSNTVLASISSSGGFLFSTDTGIHRNAAGVFEFTDGGSTADRADILAGDGEFYDDTASTGISALTVRAGAGQSTNALLNIFANDGTTSRFKVTDEGITTITMPSSVNDLALKVTRAGTSETVLIGDQGYGAGASVMLHNGTGTSFSASVGNGVEMGSGFQVRWNPDFALVGNSDDVGLGRSGIGILKVTNASTGIGALAYSRAVAAKTQAVSPYTVVVTESNYVYTNEGATSSVTFTLPAAAAGLTYTFIVQDADGDLIITAAAGDTIRDGGSASTSGGTASVTAIGDVVTIVAINADEWIIVYSKGTVTLS